MARIWMTGFEHQSLAVFGLGTTGASINTSTVRNGAASMNLGNATGNAVAALPSAVSEIYFRLGYRPTGNLGGTRAIFQVLDPNGEDHIQFQISAAKARLMRGVSGGGGTELDIGASAVFSLDAWHLVEGWCLIDTTSGEVEMRVDGVNVASFSGDTQGDGASGITTDRFRLGGSDSFSSTASDYYDDVAINDTSGSDNTSWIGEGKVVKMAPNGAGDSTDLSRGGSDSGANWSQVEEVPPNDATDYVFGSTADDHDLYALEDVSDVNSVNAIVIWHRAQKDDAGARSFARVLKSEATEDDGSDVTLSQSWEYYSEILERDPVDAALWDETKLDALQVGFKVR